MINNYQKYILFILKVFKAYLKSIQRFSICFNSYTILFLLVDNQDLSIYLFLIRNYRKDNWLIKL